MTECYNRFQSQARGKGVQFYSAPSLRFVAPLAGVECDAEVPATFPFPLR